MYKSFKPTQQLINWGVNLILPPRCPVNGDIVDAVGALSPRAWKDLHFITDPQCSCCGIPFPVDEAKDIQSSKNFLCAECLARPRPFDKARSLFVYDDASRPLILSFKHGDAIHAQKTLGPMLTKLGEEFWGEKTVLVPVPLHWLRLIKRRYNQSAVLAQAVSKLSGVPCWVDALRRVRNTLPQGHKNAKDRFQNVSKAFDINPSYLYKISGHDIVLVDDVFTTGATLEECARILKAAGADSVNVITVARAVKN